MSTNYPLEPKVSAAVGGTTVAGTVTAAVLWGVDSYIFTGGDIPAPIEGLLVLLVASAVGLVSGWYARHQHRQGETP